MAILQKFLRSAFCTERSLFLTSCRCSSGFQSHHSSPSNYRCIPQDSGSLVSVVSSSSNNGVKKPISHSLLQKIDSAILPASPVERLIKFQLPTAIKEVSLEMPTTKVSLDNVHINQKVVEIKAPQRGRVIKQLAIRMLVVRRRKMKKHKRRKYLKKFRIQLMTLYKKREFKKETAFLSDLENQFKLAEAFSAENYASEKIRKAYQPLPVKEKLVKPLPWEFQPLFYWSQKKNGK